MTGKTNIMFAAVAGFSLLTGSMSYAASCDDKKCHSNLDSLKEVEVLKKDMDEIKRVLISLLPTLVKNGNSQDVQAVPQKVEMPQSAMVSIKEGPVMGSASAPVALIEFSDYECPFCARFYSDTLKQLKKDYIDTGKLRFAYRDFPLPFHQNAMKAAMSSRCAGEQGRYWEMHDALFTDQKGLGDTASLAKRIGVGMESFEKCMESGKYADAINRDLDEGRRIGVTGTPSFVLGKVDASGNVTGELIQGAMPYGVFKSKIDALVK